MKLNKCVGKVRDYAVFDSAALIHEAVNNTKPEKLLNTDILTNTRAKADLFDMPYTENDSGQEEILGLYAALLYAGLSGISVTGSIVGYSTCPNKGRMENSIGILLGEADLLKGCTNGSSAEMLVISIGGNKAGMIVKKDGSGTRPILLPLPVFRVKNPKSAEGNPFIRDLIADENVERMLLKENLPAKNIMKERIGEEKKFYAAASDILKYDLLSKKMRAFIQLNDMEAFRMFRDILNILGGPLSRIELQKESEEIAENPLTDEITNWIKRLGIEKELLSMCGSFGTAQADCNGTEIFSTLLPFCPMNGHSADEFFYTGETDLLEPEAMTICPVNNSVLPDHLSDASVTYEFSKYPDPITCLVSYCHEGKTVRKRYGIEKFIQLRLPTIITPFRGGDPSVPLGTYIYLFDEAADPPLKIKGTDKIISDLTVEIPEVQ